MRLVNQSIIVEFLTDHNRVVAKGLNGLDIVRPERWLNKEADEEEGTRFEENVNHLETAPQICKILHTNDKLPYNAGDTVFVHYMAWENAEYTEYGAVIDIDFVFFKINEDGTFEMRKDLYLGHAIYSDEEVTPSGIIMLAGKKDNLRVTITHVPEKAAVCNIGDTVVSIDKNNYEFDYYGTKYVKLTKDEIIAVCVEDKDAVG